MSDDDWESEIKDAKQLRTKPRHVAPHKTPSKAKPVNKPRLDILPSDHLPALSIDAPSGLHKGSLKRLKRGDVTIDYKLDLHGFTQEQAYSRLMKTLTHMQQAGGRVVLVITGKGKPDKESVLRKALKQWVNEPELRPHIISMTEAPPNLGGSGAFLLYLRRNRLH